MDFDNTRAVIEAGREKQLHHGMQIYVSQDGGVLADFACGESEPGRELTNDHRMLWMSAGKPITAIGAAERWEQGDFDLDQTVAEFLPEFANNEKENVTIRHLLTHTSGFPDVRFAPDSSWDERLRTIYDAPLEPDWELGVTAGYHRGSSWYVLAELMTVWSGGRSYADLFREICEAYGMNNTWNGMPREEFENRRSLITPMFTRQKGELVAQNWETESLCLTPSPGWNTRGPARELGLFYEGLLGDLAGTSQRLLAPKTVETFISRKRAGRFDRTLQHVVDYGLGFIVDSRRHGAETVPYGFADWVSDRGFGHGGAQSSLAFADPETGFVVVTIANGMPGEPRNHTRRRELLAALGKDLRM